ncbi:MAG: 16S rRNA (cytosine(1402)-N(4))-methyltransferase RsmH [Ruminococcaceae bacterium]|nr:16S rRNA (cytosine(1402)-N(4))-methyltransferase RsmH [Oscillospiraceae bacterium]
MSFSHIPVLYDEVLDSLKIKQNGVYVDATAGGGGHSAGILEKLGEDGRLICFDRDPDAIATLTKRFKDERKVTIVHDNYCNIKSVLKKLNVGEVDGILADLGVSSHQLDTVERGFSFHYDAPLDMRMSQAGPTAADLCNKLSERELARIIRDYGEEKYATSIARNIVRARENEPIKTTLQLADIIASSMPAKARRSGHPARHTFQALRIEVNGELENLKAAVNDMFDSLKINGVLSIITFHSLEDRIVKQSFADFCMGCICPPEFPICVCGNIPRGKLIFKFKDASEEEIEKNPRSRSAKLRSIERIN